MTDFYISLTGDDGNDGSIGTPWETLDNFFVQVFDPGDNVFLERGGFYRGQVRFFNCSAPTTLGTPLTVSAYGTGDLPVVSGWLLIDPNDWTNEGGGVYSVPTTGTPITRATYNDTNLLEGTSAAVAEGEFFDDGVDLWVNTGGIVPGQVIEFSTSNFQDNCSVNCSQRPNVNHQIIENIAVEAVQMTASTARGIGIHGASNEVGGVIVQDCLIYNVKDAQTSTINISRGGSIIRDCIILGWTNGIYLVGSSARAMPNTVMQRCTITAGSDLEEFQNTSDGIKSHNTVGDHIDRCDQSGTILEDCDISGFYQDAVDLLSACDGWTVRNNHIHSPAPDNVYLGNLDGVKSGGKNMNIHNNYIHGLRRDGDNSFGAAFVSTWSAENHIHDNVVESCLVGFTVNGAPDSQSLVENNHFTNVNRVLNIGNEVTANNNTCDANLVGHGATFDINIQQIGVLNGSGNRLVNGTKRVADDGVDLSIDEKQGRINSNALVNSDDVPIDGEVPLYGGILESSQYGTILEIGTYGE